MQHKVSVSKNHFGELLYYAAPASLLSSFNEQIETELSEIQKELGQALAFFYHQITNPDESTVSHMYSVILIPLFGFPDPKTTPVLVFSVKTKMLDGRYVDGSFELSRVGNDKEDEADAEDNGIGNFIGQKRNKIATAMDASGLRGLLVKYAPRIGDPVTPVYTARTAFRIMIDLIPKDKLKVYFTEDHIVEIHSDGQFVASFLLD